MYEFNGLKNARPDKNYLQWHADTQAFLIENILLEMKITNILFILMIDSPVKL